MKTIKSLTEAEISELPKPPEGWLWAKLDTIGELFCGQSPSIKEVNQERCGIPYVTGPEQWDGSKIEETKWTEFPKRLVPEGCIFITVKGAGVGKIFPGISCAIGRDIYAFLPSSKVDFKYILHAIKHQINLVIMQAQGDIPGLSKNHILDHVIGLCSIEEQRAIVSKIEQLFSELDNGISNLKLAQEQLKVYRQAVLKKAFEGELTKKWREQQTDLPDAEDLLEQIRKEREKIGKNYRMKVKSVKPLSEAEINELPKLPKEWKWVRLDEVTIKADKVNRKEKNPEEELKYLDIGGINNKTNRLENFKVYKWIDAPSRAQQIVYKGDILFSTVRTYLKNIAKLESKEFNGEICSSGFTVIRSVKNHIDENYVFYLSIYDGFIQPLNKLQTGTSYPAVRDNDVLSQPFPLCSLPEQQAIVQEIETRLSVCDKIEQDIETNLEKAEALRQSILKKAFEGKLLNEKELAEVRGAEDWEPAEVLLERIKAEKSENGKKGKQKSKQLKSITQDDKGIIQQATLQAFEQIDK